MNHELPSPMTTLERIDLITMILKGLAMVILLLTILLFMGII